MPRLHHLPLSTIKGTVMRSLTGPSALYLYGNRENECTLFLFPPCGKPRDGRWPFLGFVMLPFDKPPLIFLHALPDTL